MLKVNNAGKLLAAFFSVIAVVGSIFFFSACTKRESYTVTLWSELNPYSWEEKHTAGWFLDFPATYKIVEVNKGDVLGDVELPDGADEHFLGWYIDKNYTLQFNHYVDPVECDMTLYAKWDVNN